MRFLPLMYGIAALLAVFSAVGFAVVVKTLAKLRAERRAAGPRPKRTLRERADAYVGPVDRSKARLTPLLRVLVEFFFSLGGFPGLGWLLSGRMVPGLLLITIVPSVVWGLMPVFLSVSGLLLRSAYSVVAYLPVLAAVSAGSLLVTELRTARPEAGAA